MGQTFVYNSGESTPPPGTLDKTYGMFFDGTGNNLRNTEIRKKVQKVEEYANQNIKGNVATDDEKKIYRKKAQTWLWKNEKDNSYKNDFSNVARMNLCSKQDYRIYTEGIGTEDEESDNLLPGQAFGTGATGIRQKVRKGCDSLVEKIKEEIKNIEDLEKIELTLDVSGFSRGAATARNFVYEVKKEADKPWQKPVPGGRGITLPADSFGEYIDERYLIDGELPPHGHLGYALVKAGVDKELVKTMTINIRFVGVYDTVASYGLNHEKGVERLHLDNLGVATKVVHFTAMDEHRKNFALTRIKTGTEKNFPGVHSDIGGSYDNGEETVEKLEIDTGNRKYRKVFGDALERFKKKLIAEGWYFEKELDISVFPSRYLSGTRTLRKEYSYLILHYMEYYAKKLLVDNEFIMSTITEYPIKDTLLQNAKIRLDDYVKEDGEEWRLTSYREIEKEEVTVYAEEEEQQKFPIWIPDESLSETEEEITIDGGELEGIIIYPYDDWLKDLRHRYFHWSADYDSTLGSMNPTKDRKRIEI